MLDSIFTVKVCRPVEHPQSKWVRLGIAVRFVCFVTAILICANWTGERILRFHQQGFAWLQKRVGFNGMAGFKIDQSD